MENEVWATGTNAGTGNLRYWTFSTAAGRAVPVKRADAQHGLMTGTLFLIAKPEYVGR